MDFVIKVKTQIVGQLWLFLIDQDYFSGILMAEIEIDSSRSAVVATTHLQAPTGGNRVKAELKIILKWLLMVTNNREMVISYNLYGFVIK